MPEIDGGSVLGARARSASDAAVLRRKGHLKEQDRLIEFLLSMHDTHTSLEAMQKMERWIIEHRQVGQYFQAVQSTGKCWTFTNCLCCFQRIWLHEEQSLSVMSNTPCHTHVD